MLEAARVIAAQQKLDAIDIAAVPSCTPEYSKELKRAFKGPLKKDEEWADEPALEGVAARDALVAMFNGKVS